MNLIIQGSSSFSVSERMKKYIEKRLKKLNYFDQHIDEIKFHLDAEKKHTYKIDAIIITHKFGTYKFHASDREMYTTIDKIVHKMDVKIYREKTKIKNHSKPGHHEEVITEFFTEHERDEPEPTKMIELNQKPTTLQDAYLHMVQENSDFFGFNYIKDEKEAAEPAFLRKLEDDITYLFTKQDDINYIEYSLTGDNTKVEVADVVRTIPLKKLNLLSAQREVLKQDYFFGMYIDSSSEKVSFLLKEGNGKWKLMS